METKREVATRIGFEPTIFAVTGRRVRPLHHRAVEPLGMRTPGSNPSEVGGDSENASPSPRDSRECDLRFASLACTNSTLRGSPAATQGGAPDAGSVPAQRSLFDVPLRFDGADYLPWRDDARLTGQLRRVWGCVRDGFWWTPSELERATGDNWSSISAQLRHLRKERFGSHTIERAHLGRGLYQYRLVTNIETAGAITPTASSHGFTGGTR